MHGAAIVFLFPPRDGEGGEPAIAGSPGGVIVAGVVGHPPPRRRFIDALPLRDFSAGVVGPPREGEV